MRFKKVTPLKLTDYTHDKNDKQAVQKYIRDMSNQIKTKVYNNYKINYDSTAGYEKTRTDAEQHDHFTR